MKNIDSVMEKLIAFRDERDWEQFHNSKDLALAISIEAAELLEVFLWKKNEENFPRRNLKRNWQMFFPTVFYLPINMIWTYRPLLRKK